VRGKAPTREAQRQREGTTVGRGRKAHQVGVKGSFQFFFLFLKSIFLFFLFLFWMNTQACHKFKEYPHKHMHYTRVKFRIWHDATLHKGFIS
jgi:hypothetical protein